MVEKNNFGFPISYGDAPCNEGNRLSDAFLTVVQSQRFKNISSALASAILIIGGQSQVGHAIPPEASEHVANAADVAVNAGQATGLQPDVNGRIAGGVANAAGPKPLHPVPGVQPNRPGLPGAPGGPPKPGQPPIYMPLGRPVTPTARTLNTVAFTGSFAWVCLNAYWGNPVAIAGCSVMVIAWFANLLGIHITR